jgi:hypothetical protein
MLKPVEQMTVAELDEEIAYRERAGKTAGLRYRRLRVARGVK